MIRITDEQKKRYQDCFDALRNGLNFSFDYKREELKESDFYYWMVGDEGPIEFDESGPSDIPLPYLILSELIDSNFIPVEILDSNGVAVDKKEFYKEIMKKFPWKEHYYEEFVIKMAKIIVKSNDITSSIELCEAILDCSKEFGVNEELYALWFMQENNIPNAYISAERYEEVIDNNIQRNKKYNNGNVGPLTDYVSYIVGKDTPYLDTFMTVLKTLSEKEEHLEILQDFVQIMLKYKNSITDKQRHNLVLIYNKIFEQIRGGEVSDNKRQLLENANALDGKTTVEPADSVN